MLDKIAELNNRARNEAMMTLKLLALVLSGPLKEYSEFPNWAKCKHVDLAITTNWPDVERELMPAMNNLAANLNHHNLEPTDICIIRTKEYFCICVRH